MVTPIPDCPYSPRQGIAVGLLAAAVALAVGELVSGLVRGTTSPVVSVGGFVIDHVPPSLKVYAVRTFGTNDKPALIIGTLVLLALFAAGVGIVARRRRWLGYAGIALFGVVGVGAALTRPAARALDVLPSVLGALPGSTVGRFCSRARVWVSLPPRPGAWADNSGSGSLYRRPGRALPYLLRPHPPRRCLRARRLASTVWHRSPPPTLPSIESTPRW